MIASLLLAIRRRWLVVLLCVLASVAGAMLTAVRMSPRYVGKANVLMELVRPDPETGEAVPSKMLEDYVGTQMRLAASQATTRHMIAQFGWLDDPALQDEFLTTGQPSDQMESWLATRLAGAVSVSVVPESNLLQLAYVAPDRDNAKLLADSLRSAYLEEVVAQKRDRALRSAAWLDRQARYSERRYTAALEARNRYAAERGIVVGRSARDERGMALAMLGRNGTPFANTAPPRRPTAAPAGPRPLVGPGSLPVRDAAEPAAPEETPAVTPGPLQASLGGGDSHFQTRAGTAELARRAYIAVIARRNQAQQDAQTGDSNLSAFGDATVDADPVFPNYALILGGAAGFGLILGLEAALLLELLNRKVRSVTDLGRTTGTDALRIVAAPRRRFRRWPRLPRMPRPWKSLRLPFGRGQIGSATIGSWHGRSTVYHPQPGR